MSSPKPRLLLYRRVLRYFLPDLRWIVLFLGILGFAMLLGLAQVWPMAILVDSVLAPTPRWGRFERLLVDALPESRLAHVILLAGVTLVLRVAQELLNLARAMISIRIGNHSTLRVRCDLYQKLQALSLQYHRGQPQGDTLYRINIDTAGLQAIFNVLVNTGVAAVTLLVMTAILLSRSAPLTLLALSIVPLLIWTNIHFGRLLRTHSVQAKEVDSRLMATVQRSLSSITLVQAFGREAEEYGRFRASVTSSLGAWYRYHWQLSCYRLITGSLFAAGGALIFGYGGYLVYRDQFLSPRPSGMTLGDLMIFITYLGLFYDPLCKITGAGASMQEGIAGAQRVFEILDRDPVIEDAPDALPLPQRPRTLSLSGVGFSYSGSDWVLRDIEVTIRPGEMVAFVGSSGVGKSTLMNLLPRFYNPTRGSLRLDGHDLRRVRLRDLRRHIALVLQNSIILPGTVAENIAYGRPDATEHEIFRAAELAGAASFIANLPGGYEFQISEEGQNLSGGQRQRIAIARALLTEAPILLLDEPTSALDPLHEALVTETLRSLKGLRTIVLVSHRLSTVLDCDQIFVMHQGRIAERGSHEELLAQEGIYWQMAQHQLALPRCA